MRVCPYNTLLTESGCFAFTTRTRPSSSAEAVDAAGADGVPAATAEAAAAAAAAAAGRTAVADSPSTGETERSGPQWAGTRVPSGGEGSGGDADADGLEEAVGVRDSFGKRPAAEPDVA